jgi:hypothetical protein
MGSREVFIITHIADHPTSILPYLLLPPPSPPDLGWPAPLPSFLWCRCCGGWDPLPYSRIVVLGV